MYSQCISHSTPVRCSVYIFFFSALLLPALTLAHSHTDRDTYTDAAQDTHSIVLLGESFALSGNIYTTWLV